MCAEPRGIANVLHDTIVDSHGRHQGNLDPVRSGLKPPGSPDLGVAKAADDVVVDQSRGLHQGVADRRADEREPSSLQILAQHVRLTQARTGISEWDRHEFWIGRPPGELPDVDVEAAKFFLNCQERLCILDSRGNLEAVADDPGVGEQFLDFAPVVAGDPRQGPKPSKTPPGSSSPATLQGSCPNSDPPGLPRGPGTRTTGGRRGPERPTPRRGSGPHRSSPSRIVPSSAPSPSAAGAPVAPVISPAIYRNGHDSGRRPSRLLGVRPQRPVSSQLHYHQRTVV